MRYVPNLIPKDKKVLPHYFKGNPYIFHKKTPILNALGYIGGVFFFFLALVYLNQPIAALLFGLIGVAIIPPGHNKLEKMLRFRFTVKIKMVTCSLLFLLTIPFINEQSKLDAQVREETISHKKAEQEKKQKYEKAEVARKDSFNLRYNRIKQLENDKQIDAALVAIDSELRRNHSVDEINSLDNTKYSITHAKVSELLKRGDYKNALPLVSELLSRNNNSDTNLLYDRSVCFYKTGKIQEAVTDLKLLVDAGNKKASKLYDKINPIKKRIIGYTTLCCDGTTSNARGRGACSWHGGVCDWNHPIYEEYRKYE